MNSTQYAVQLRATDNPHLVYDVSMTADFEGGISGAEQYAYFLAAQHSAKTGQTWYVSGVICDSNNFVMNAHPAYFVRGTVEIKEVV